MQHVHPEHIVERRTLSRRLFLSGLGRNTMAVAVLGSVAAACSSTAEAPQTSGATEATTGQTGQEESSGEETTSALGAEPDDLQWAEVSFGFVSAYVLVRGSEVAVVDTGTGGAGAIETTLTSLNLGWDAVNHVIVTHAHGDHIGGLADVMTAATSATAYAGAADIENMTAPRDIVAVNDGEEIFGLQVLATPGHTPGHISVLDPDSGLLVAGDALIAQSGVLEGPSAQFSDDLDLANSSARSLADDSIGTILLGHGGALDDGGEQLAAVIASL